MRLESETTWICNNINNNKSAFMISNVHIHVLVWVIFFSTNTHTHLCFDIQPAKHPILRAIHTVQCCNLSKGHNITACSSLHSGIPRATISFSLSLSRSLTRRFVVNKIETVKKTTYILIESYNSNPITIT